MALLGHHRSDKSCTMYIKFIEELTFFTLMHCAKLSQKAFKARLHVKREGTARLETSTVSRRNLLFTRTNSVMYPTEKGTVLESPLERVLDCLHVVFFETGNDRARDN